MRKREEIWTDYQQAKKISGSISDKDAFNAVGNLLSLEVLLDIRDLLANPIIEISGAPIDIGLEVQKLP